MGLRRVVLQIAAFTMLVTGGAGVAAELSSPDHYSAPLGFDEGRLGLESVNEGSMSRRDCAILSVPAVGDAGLEAEAETLQAQIFLPGPICGQPCLFTCVQSGCICQMGFCRRASVLTPSP